jgi:hypothetical protein
MTIKSRLESDLARFFGGGNPDRQERSPKTTLVAIFPSGEEAKITKVRAHGRTLFRVETPSGREENNMLRDLCLFIEADHPGTRFERRPIR